jgi:enamine deaminase RidA (YjgF/YER057c/UK114 family)
MPSPEERLKELGIELPKPPKPLAAYVPAVRAGDLVFISGQAPMRDGKPVYTGRVGADLTLEEGYEAARLVMINALAVLKEEIGSLDNVERIVKVLGWVNSAPDFTQQPQVINGASELLEQVFGERGRHARSAVSAHTLPFNIAVEIEMIVQVK